MKKAENTKFGKRAIISKQPTNCKLEIDLFEGIWNDEGFVFMGR